MAVENRTTRDRDLTDVLGEIKEQMQQRKQLRAQEEMTSEIKKLNNTLTSNTAKKQPPQIKVPSGRDIANAFIKSSPIFGRDFSGWIKDTARYSQASNDELVQANKNLSRLETGNGSSDQLVYLELIADQTGALTDMVQDRADKQLIRLDSIDKSIGQMGLDLVNASEGDSRKAFNEGRLQLKATMDIKTAIGSGVGRVVGELVKLRQDISRGSELKKARDNEDKKDSKNDGLGRAGVVTPTVPDADTSGAGGFLAGAGALAALGLLKKVMFAPLALVRGLTGIFTGMSGILPMLGKASKFLRVGPLALLTSVFEFGKGFFNAKEILGKGQVTVLDRVRAGISEMLGSFGDLADWITKIFGFDTNIGKTIREGFLYISQKPFEWAQTVVDWFKNDLFGGINMNTSLTDIPGKIAENLQSELTKFVDWMSDGIASLWDDAKASLSSYIEDTKKAFSDKVKKPVFEFINAVTASMFDILDKFVELIPDALGGATARKKMEDLRKNMTIDIAPDPNVVKSDQANILAEPTSNSATSPQLSAPQREVALPTQAATVQEMPKGSVEPIHMMAATPQYGQAAINTQQIKEAQQPSVTVVAPINNSKTNVNAPQNTTILNSPSLNPVNTMVPGVTSLWNQ